LCRDTYIIKPDDVEMMKTCDIDLESFLKRYMYPMIAARKLIPNQGFLAWRFKREVLPKLLENFEQIGFKEIRNERWRNYLKHFPNMKIILNGRDPRDIYVSLYHRVQKGKSGWQEPFMPEAVAAHLNFQFSLQMEM
jgi:hypothetical protein